MESPALFLDLEVARDGRVREVGAILGEAALHLSHPRAADWARLDRFAAGADLVVGHNLLEHDLPHLARAAPGLALLAIPAVDTLVLSPLCFPRRPYHHLVKEHRLVRDAANDPVADARLCARLLADEQAAIAALGPAHPLPRFWRHVLGALTDGQHWAGGFARFLDGLGIPADPPWDVLSELFAALAPHACAEALRTLRAELTGLTLPLAYAASWLLQADPGSVLPAWVRHRHPAVATLLADLRERPCGHADCPWCPAEHHPEALLERFFGFTSFRAEPRDPGGGSLQRAIVLAGLRAEPLYAVLPTGGGKSLCYQVPALARHRRLGLLTVVVSPLQSLMKDQVDGLVRATGSGHVAALHGMVTAPERTRALTEVADGTCGLLYVSPEQLRNRSVRKALVQRQIGAWVFDEAHCLSAWGHDFRTDYLYAPRFIAELAGEQGCPPPPIACFTATSQKAVTAQIQALFRQRLGQDLRLLAAGIDRENLLFDVQPVSEPEKLGRILEILAMRLGAGQPGAAIVFNATRKRSEELAAALAAEGWHAAPYHAGLDPNAKRDIQDRFLGGGVRVICATSAFGMGIDKPDVRLVIHAETPGSLESYLQQAGRAGRDRKDAHCILLASDHDLETQFSLWARNRLTQDEIASVLRAVRHARKCEGPVVLTAGELLRMEETAASLSPDDSMGPTKVATAVYWLEQARFLQRDLNVTHLFQGRPRVASLQEAEARMERRGLPPATRTRWLTILRTLLNAAPDEGFNADDLAALAGPEEAGGLGPLEAGLRMLRTLREMGQAGLVTDGLRLSAFVRHKVRDPSTARLSAAIELERALIALMQEEYPDAGDGEWAEAGLRGLNQRLLEQGLASSPQSLAQVLKALRDDRAPDQPAAGGSLELHWVSRGRYRVRLRRTWDGLKEVAQRRHDVARTTLAFLADRLPAGAPASAEALAEFGLGELIDACQRDLVLAARLQDHAAAAQRALLYLHDLKVITLQNGLAVFRQAMTIALDPDGHGRRYGRQDYEPLRQHYDERVIQIHVMGAYARIGAGDVDRALRYAREWFERDREDFLQDWFPGDAELLHRATSQRSWQRIVEDLRDRDQQRVVTEKAGVHLLVLAGPGSGKTRTLVHRCAWLLRVQRVPPESLLVLCYNRATAHELRRRLHLLLEGDARGVTVSTLHGLALRITGRSLADARRVPESDEPLFDAILDEAASLLEGHGDVSGLEPDELRERLLEGYRHVLVDEYQDIDARQYRLLCAIAGRTAGASGQELPLSLFAVGDDDQNIYAFRGASTAYIRSFQADYDARARYLVSNWRSTARIIQASQALIAHAPDRMKRDHVLHIDPARRHDPPGGRFDALDPLARGRVQRVVAPSAAAEAAFVLAELRRLRGLDPGAGWGDFAALARTRRDLGPLRALLERQGVPCRWEVPGGLALHRVREPALLLEALAEARSKPLTVAEVAEILERLADGRRPNPWWELLRCQVAVWAEELGDSPRTGLDLRRDLWEMLAEQGQRQHFGQGVLLATLHAAKGLEYPHVFLLDCGRTVAADERDAERRLLYVGMTRARETLCLCARGAAPVGLMAEADHPDVLDRVAPPAPTGEEPPTFEVLDLGDLFLDWAGRRPSEHPVHARLAALEVGDPVTLAHVGDGIAVLDPEGQPVARLAQAAAARWSSRLERIQAALVIAVVRREGAQVQPEFAAKLRAERWELPLVEILVG